MTGLLSARRSLPSPLQRAAALAFVALALAAPRDAAAQNSAPTGLQMALAMEEAMTTAIAEAEKSVVAIARIRKTDIEAAATGPLPDPFGQPFNPRPGADPNDPDFIPNDFGTGVVVDRNGLILTCKHLLGDTDSNEYRISITSSDRRKFVEAKVLATDPRSDLAVLKIPDVSDMTPIKFGNGAALKKGQIVIALGNPYAIARDGQASASWGIVANLSRKAPPLPPDEMRRTRPTLHHYGTLIQTDAKLNLGTSGGALINLKGEMVGLTTSLAAIVGYEQAAGYAVPVDETFLRVVETLKQGREVEYGLLGIIPQNLLSEDGRSSRGALVTGVQVGTPAQKFGLEVEDIVTAVNGQPVFDADTLVLNVGRLNVGAIALLSVERQGRMMRLAVELAKFPVSGQKVFKPEPLWRGMQVDYKTALPDLGMGLIPAEDCIVVTEVQTDTQAWKAGVRQGMYISHVEGRPVRKPSDFREAVADKPGAVKLRLPLEVDSERTRVVEP